MASIPDIYLTEGETLECTLQDLNEPFAKELLNKYQPSQHIRLKRIPRQSYHYLKGLLNKNEFLFRKDKITYYIQVL